MIMTKEQFANALMEAFAQYQGCETWRDYASLVRIPNPCSAGRVAIDWGWSKYEQLPPETDDFERFLHAALKAQQWYEGFYAPYKTSVVQRILQKIYEQLSNQPR
jgi:hypothetical protein